MVFERSNWGPVRHLILSLIISTMILFSLTLGQSPPQAPISIVTASTKMQIDEKTDSFVMIDPLRD